MNIVYEQPAQFNRYVDETIPLTWSYRWRSLRSLVPAIIFIYVTTAELLALRLWQDDGLSAGELPLVLLAPLSIIPLLLVSMEALLRIRHRSKRVLKLRDKRLSLSPSKVSQVRWEHVRGWRFEPIQSQPGLAKLTVLFGPARQGGWRRRWSMVLTSQKQRDDLLAQLESRRGSRISRYEVCVMTLPFVHSKPERVQSSSSVGIWIYTLGVFLFLHGWLPLGFGMVSSRDPAHADPALAQPASQPKERFRAWLTAHLASRADARRLALIVGGTLTVCAAASVVGGSIVMNRSLRRTWAAREAEVLTSK